MLNIGDQSVMDLAVCWPLIYRDDQVRVSDFGLYEHLVVLFYVVLQRHFLMSFKSVEFPGFLEFAQYIQRWWNFRLQGLREFGQHGSSLLNVDCKCVLTNEEYTFGHGLGNISVPDCGQVDFTQSFELG